MPDISVLQPFQQSSKVFQTMFNAVNQQVALRQNTISDLRNQEFVDTATWGLSYYEKDLGIIADPTLSYDERRTVIRAKMRWPAPTSKQLIQTAFSSYTNGDVDVYISNSTIVIKCIANFGDYLYQAKAVASIDAIIPAHLAFAIELIISNSTGSGYTVSVFPSSNPKQLAIQPNLGTFAAGVLPFLDTDGEMMNATADYAPDQVTGTSSNSEAGHLVSGGAQEYTSTCAVLSASLDAIAEITIGSYRFPLSGTFDSGILPSPINSGSLVSDSIKYEAYSLTGKGSSFVCGGYACGEEVA